jgi:hypothetical protein
MKDVVLCEKDPDCYWEYSMPAILKCKNVITVDLCENATTEKEVSFLFY